MEHAVLMLLFATTSNQFSLPTGLQSALCWVESNHRTEAVNIDDGSSDSLGVCQIQLDTAKFLGFKGTRKQLMEPKTNVYYSGLYLKTQIDRYQGDIYKAIGAYNSGTYMTRRNQKPVNKVYIDRVLKAWSESR